jgi:hypothetical protein
MQPVVVADAVFADGFGESGFVYFKWAVWSGVQFPFHTVVLILV